MRKKNQPSEISRLGERLDTLISVAFALGVLLILGLFVYVLMTEVYRSSN